MGSAVRYHLILLRTIDSHTAQQSHLTLLFSRAERAAPNLNFRKMLENEAIEASRCNSLLCRRAWQSER